MTTIHSSVAVGVEQAALLKALSPERLRAFMETQAAPLVAQVRANVIRQGARAGDWSPLSAEYAKSKRKGQTPGHGKYRYSMLRDTGMLVESLRGEVRWDGRGMVLELTAEGQGSGRPPNDKLLHMHATGEGRLPKRNPAEHMDLFEKRFAEKLAAYLSADELKTTSA